MNVNRLDWEESLLGILSNHIELIDRIIFSVDWFELDIHKRFYRYLKEYREMNAELLQSSFSSEEIENVVMPLFVNNVYEKSAASMALGYANMILEDYRQECIDQLDDKRKFRMINTDRYYMELTRLKNLSCEQAVEILTPEMIDEMVMDDGEGIRIDRFYYLSRLCKIDVTDIVTIAATSGFGKSAFLLNVYQALSQNKDKLYKCHYFNIEVSPKGMVKRLLAITSNRRVDEFNRQSVKEPFYWSAKEKLQNDSYINSGSITLEELKAKVLNNMDNEKINVVFVDHIGLLDTDEKAYSRTEYDRVTYCMKELRKFALDNNLIVFIASQFDRASVKDGKLSMHSLKSSGEIENSSTHVLLLQKSQKRESENAKVYEEVLIDVAKNRNGSIGVLDSYTFYKNKQIFEENKR